MTEAVDVSEVERLRAELARAREDVDAIRRDSERAQRRAIQLQLLWPPCTPLPPIDYEAEDG